MTADELAARVRSLLAEEGAIREVEMFGGIGFLLNGNMVAATSPRGLLARVGRDRQAEALAQPGSRPMVMRGRAMGGHIRIDAPALSDGAVAASLALARAFVRSLPPKVPGVAAPRAKQSRR